MYVCIYIYIYIYVCIYIQSPQSPTYRNNSVPWGVSLSSAWLRAHTDGLQRPPAGLSHACSSLLNSLEQKNHGFLIMFLFCLFRMTLLLYSFFFSLSLSRVILYRSKKVIPLLFVCRLSGSDHLHIQIYSGGPPKDTCYCVWRGVDLQEDAWRQS